MKSFVLSLTISVIIILLLPNIDTSQINAFFLSGLLLLLIGATTFVIRSGFLNLFFKGFIMIREVLFRQPDFMKEVNDNIQNDSSFIQWKENVTKQLMRVAFGSGLGMIIISTIWAF